MLTYIIYLFAGLGGGTLAANCIPSFLFTNPSQFISILVLDPFTFFIGMICFFIGFVANANLIRSCIEQTYAFTKGANIKPLFLVISYLVTFSLAVIFFINLSIAISFLIFSFLYGMISLDITRYMPVEVGQEEL